MNDFTDFVARTSNFQLLKVRKKIIIYVYIYKFINHLFIIYFASKGQIRNNEYQSTLYASKKIFNFIVLKL